MNLLTPKDVQRMLKVSLSLVYRMAERGQLPCVRWECPGKGKERKRETVRFEKEVVIDFIKDHRQNGQKWSQAKNK
jgi:hypothetical protein